jgi:hypothetical protein
MDPMLPENVTAAAPAAAPASEYEFNDAQNRVFSDLGGAMGFVAVALVVLGVFSTLVGGLALLDGARADGLAGLVQGVVLLLIGIWTRGASGSVRQIVSSSGSDIANLMHAMEHLGRVYRLQRVLLLIAIVLLVLGIAAGALSGAGGH